tara:strand:- start:70975 stop:73290 length:2316 start_codon:yes stop_codon:yes gene_type:complete
MVKNLVIVESPAKAKTIEKFLGKDYTVKSSFGHIRDLPGKSLAVDVEHNYEPKYVIPSDKKKIVSELKKLAKEAETVWLASDEDREGEAIAWHLSEALDLDDEKTKRIVFHEITKNAILNAIKQPRKINKNLVDAQQARRVLDRLVGYELSPVLWKKVKPSLSAGRVQSVAVRLIVEREREIQNFKSTSSYKVTAYLLTDNNEVVKAELPKRFKDKESALAFVKACQSADFIVENIESKPSYRSPSAPFTTSTLQQEASRKLGFTVAQTMSLAQKLYEAGKITYMRTDSVNLSQDAINTAKDVIVKEFGEKYSNPRQYTTKSKGAQEAHEAIRPTYLQNKTAGESAQMNKLYDLIWKRTIASQMANAQFEKTTATITVTTANEKLVAKGEVLKFDGFLKVYMESKDDDQITEEDEAQQGMLPKMDVGQHLKLKSVEAVQRFTQHPPRYTEASLVRKLEELGIGRPSTYAPTISTIQKRGYVVKEDREGVKREYNVIKLENNEIKEEVKVENTGAEKKKLFPTDIGIVVTDFLVDHFKKILDYSFTAKVEEQFDEVAQGLIEWYKMIDNFYGPFHKNVEETLKIEKKSVGERVLGTDPKTGKPVIARIGRFGPMIQIGSAEDEEKPKFASLQKNQSIETITLEEALKLFDLPKVLGEYEGKEVSVNIGRFGPYVKFDKLFVSIPKEEDPMKLTLERAVELIEEKKKAEANKYIKTFPENKDVQVLNGRYGPYIKIGKKNIKIPKDIKPEELTLEQCLELAEKAPAKKKRSKK